MQWTESSPFRRGSATSRSPVAVSSFPASARNSPRLRPRSRLSLVNPTLLRLITQRGPIACDGAWFVVVGYGNGHQLVIPLSDGHRSVNFELSASPLEDMVAITRICQTSGFPASAPLPSSGANPDLFP
jgi:hypothetical protein